MCVGILHRAALGQGRTAFLFTFALFYSVSRQSPYEVMVYLCMQYGK